MAAITRLRYIGASSPFHLPTLGVTVEHGQEFLVDAAVAGTVPADDHLGTGLLAQVDNFEPATPVGDLAEDPAPAKPKPGPTDTQEG